MVKSCCGLLERCMLKVIRRKCALSRNGVFFTHETTSSTRDAVQRGVLKAFFAWKKHMLKGFR